MTPSIAFAGCVPVIDVLYWAQPVLVPIALAMLLMFVLTPPVSWLERSIRRCLRQYIRERPSWTAGLQVEHPQYPREQRRSRRMAYASGMSYVNALWLATALWVLAVLSLVTVLGVSSWGVVLILFLGAGPLLIGHRLWSARGSTMSQDIQSQLR